METPKIRKANSSDVKDIIRLLVELAVYEKEPDADKALIVNSPREGGQSIII